MHRAPEKIRAVVSILFAATTFATGAARAEISERALADATKAVDAKVLEWRRDFHEHPELSNRETRTADVVAKKLRALGLEVKTGIAITGVAAVLRGGQPGPTIALRADMDALPVTEQNDLTFKSKVTTQFRGETVGVMHACGHDAHTAILLGVAEVLAGLRKDLRGTVLFIFQPAEEGAPDGETGGASRMMAEGLFKIAKPEAVFGLHVISSLSTGVIGYRSGPMMAGSDSFAIRVTGQGTHGSRPWGGVDPIVASAQIINALQTIVSRQVDITALPAVITVGAIKGGIRYNIIPDTVDMVGTLRTFDDGVRKDIIERMDRTVKNIAAASGATGTLTMGGTRNPPVVNDATLTQKMLPTLERVAGKQNVQQITLQTTAEDFSFYGREAASLFFWVGITPKGRDAASAAFNHSPLFYVDESGIPLGTRAMLAVAVDYLQGK
jgi:amidohydrolase